MTLLFANLTIPPARSVNAAAAGSNVRQLAGAGVRQVVPLVYGEDRLGGLVLNVLPAAAASTTVVVQVLWCFACDSINDLRWNDQVLPGGVTATHYTGAQTTVDATMVAAFSGQGVTYTDTLNGYAYSVFSFAADLFDGQLNFSARIRGRKLYDTRLDSTAGGSGAHRANDPATWTWSDCPALALADFLGNATYGAASAVDYTTVAAVANANDAMIGSPAEKRRIVGVSFTAPADVANVADALRVYAGCWLLPGVNGIKLLADADGSSQATYAHDSGQIASIEPLTLRDLGNSPTAVEVLYTDTSRIPYREGSATAQLSGAGTTLPWRLSQVRLPGIKRHSQAYREAVERLNKLTLQDISTVIEVFDQGIQHDRGDIITVTHPVGLSARLMRVVDVAMTGLGRWRLSVVEHDPASYSTAVVTLTTLADGSRIIGADPAISWASIIDRPPDSELLNLQGSYAVYLAWNFTASAEGWTAGGGSLSSGGTSITVTASGTDPQLVGPAMAVSGTVFDRVRARIKRTAGAGWDGTAFYATASHTWETAYRKTVAPDPTVLGQWRVVEWDMSALTAGGSDWLANTITGLRLDLGATSADVFEVDWIGIGTVGPASYGATWGQNVAGSAAVDAAISAAQATATSAAGAASTAQTSANTANAAIADSAADNKLSPVEKQRDKILFDAIVAEKSGIDARADAFSITTEKTAYGSAYSTLYTYALGLLANVTTTSDIDGPTYRSNFGALYSARQVLLNKIAEEAGKRASWATVTGTGKPADFANNSSVGGYVNADPTLIRPDMWSHSNTSGAVAAWANDLGAGEGLWTALDKSAGGRDDIFSESMPVSPLRSYRIEAWIYKWSGSAAAHYLFVEFRDAAGAVVTTSTGWAAVGAYNFWGLAGAAPAAVGPNAYTFTFGRFGTATIPATAVTMRVGILGGYSGAGRWSMGSLRLREYTDQATLTSATWLTAGPGMELIGNTAAKTGGSADWSSAVYSKDSFTGGAYVSCVPAQTNLQFMIGLNADPTTDAGFTSIDYALHAKTDGTLDVYSAGVLTAVSIGTYAAGDVLAVQYDGYRFTFARTGAVLYSIINAAFASVPLYADSSIYSVGTRVSGLTFGPMSTVSGLATQQLAANAATIVYEYIASASVTITGLSHTPDGANSSWNTEVGSVSVPAQAVDHDAVVTFLATATMTAGASSGSLRYSVQDDVSWDDWKKQYVSQTAGTSSGERPIQVERRFSVPAGVARTYKAWACKLNSDDTATINHHSLKVEILRR